MYSATVSWPAIEDMNNKLLWDDDIKILISPIYFPDFFMIYHTFKMANY